MKITSTQYALSLYEVTKDKSFQEVDRIVFNLARILCKRSQLKTAPSIIRKFRDIYNRENKIIEAEIISREKLDDRLSHQIIDYIGKKYGVERVSLNNKIDEKIKGGIIIKVGDEIIDASITRKLKDLKSKLIS